MRMDDFRIEIVSLPISLDQNRIGIGKKIDDDQKISKVIRKNDLKHWLKHHLVVKLKLQHSTSKLTWDGNKRRHCIATFVLLASFTLDVCADVLTALHRATCILLRQSSLFPAVPHLQSAASSILLTLTLDLCFVTPSGA